MLAIILALNAFNSPIRTVQLRERLATSLCMEAINILKQMEELERIVFQ